jgi:hypothetical protein
MHRPLCAIALAALTLTACGGGGDGGGQAITNRVSAAAIADGTTSTTVCDLLTPDEVNAAAGATLTRSPAELSAFDRRHQCPWSEQVQNDTAEQALDRTLVQPLLFRAGTLPGGMTADKNIAESPCPGLTGSVTTTGRRFQATCERNDIEFGVWITSPHDQLDDKGFVLTGDERNAEIAKRIGNLVSLMVERTS